MAKAFDTVNHDIMVKEIEKLGFQGNLIKLLKNNFQIVQRHGPLCAHLLFTMLLLPFCLSIYTIEDAFSFSFSGFLYHIIHVV